MKKIIFLLRFFENFFSAHRYCLEQYSAHLFFALIMAQISFSANQSMSAKDRYCCESMRFFAIVLRFALKEIWAVIEVKNRYFSTHRYCSEQYSAYLFFALIMAQISFSANRSTIAKNRILSQQYLCTRAPICAEGNLGRYQSEI